MQLLKTASTGMTGGKNWITMAKHYKRKSKSRRLSASLLMKTATGLITKALMQTRIAMAR